MVVSFLTNELKVEIEVIDSEDSTGKNDLMKRDQLLGQACTGMKGYWSISIRIEVAAVRAL